jgi:predicted NBD/HSP70 family sugar kinase
MPETQVVIGLDVGASKWVAVTQPVDNPQVLLKAMGRVTDDPISTLTEICTWVSAVTTEQSRSVAAVGCSFAGGLDQNGVVTAWPNRPTWKGTPLRHALRPLSGLSLFLDDDGVCAAYGEKKHGVAAPYDNFICIAIGTGVGSGLYLLGDIWPRPRRESLSLGHFRVGIDKECSCGLRGCLQTVFSGVMFKPGGLSSVSDPNVGAGIRRLSELVADVARLLALEAVVLTGGLLVHVPDLSNIISAQIETDLQKSDCAVLISRDPMHSSAHGALAMAKSLIAIGLP